MRRIPHERSERGGTRIPAQDVLIKIPRAASPWKPLFFVALADVIAPNGGSSHGESWPSPTRIIAMQTAWQQEFAPMLRVVEESQNG